MSGDGLWDEERRLKRGYTVHERAAVERVLLAVEARADTLSEEECLSTWSFFIGVVN